MTVEELRRSNILKFIVITTLCFLLAQLYFFSQFTDNTGVVIYLSCLVVWESTVLFLNYRKKHILARLLFLVSAYPVLLSLPIYFGESSHFHYYLFPASGMPLIFFKNEIGKWKWLLSLLAFPCWFYIEWHFGHFNGLFEIPPDLLAGFQFYNETLVIITATVMFAVFTKESDEQIERIETQNVQLTEFEESRTRSIEYAKKIQVSIFPTPERMDAMFPNNFVFHRPKDIVGGDFYWIKEIGESRFLVVADCTGHGVPGALLTMMIQSHLDAIVTDEKMEVNAILSQLHRKVLSSLKTGQGSRHTEDGCDLSVVKLTGTNALEFAGANAAMYLVRGSNIQKFKGDSASVGGSNLLGEIVPDQTFELTKVNVEEGDKVYLMTDGILDVYNAEHQDFGSFKLKELLSDLSELDAYRASDYIEQSLRDFQGNTESIDDILMVGFEIF